MTREWRKLYSEKLHNFYSPPNIIRQIKSRRMRWVEHLACMEDERKLYKVLVGKAEGKRPLGKQRHRFEDGIRMDLKGTCWGHVDWIQLAQDSNWWQDVNAVMNVLVLLPLS
jgi:hypothetical protein